MIIEESDRAPEPGTLVDAVIVGCGYESRSTWVSSQSKLRAERKIALSFGYLESGSYLRNRTFLEQNDFQILRGGMLFDLAAISDLFRSIGTTSIGDITLVVDYSVMSRLMMANVLLSIKRSLRGRQVRLFGAYSAAGFTPPLEAFPVEVAQPVRPEFAGWFLKPELPLNCIVGLGHEPDLALGALQYLEPSKTWLFYPSGFDPRFKLTLDQSNSRIHDVFNVVNLEYPLASPTVTRGLMFQILSALDLHARFAVVPLGPKMFAWCAMITYLFSMLKNVSIWRFSSDAGQVVVDRQAEGPIVWHSLIIRP